MCILRRECRKHRTKPEIQRYSSYALAIEALAKGKCKYMLSDGATAGANIYGRYCNEVFFTGNPITRHGASFILAKGSPYTRNLSLATLHMMEHGLLLPLEDYFVKQGQCPQPAQKPSLSLDQLSVFFIIAFATCGLILIEMIFDPQREKTDIQQSQSVDISKPQNSAPVRTCQEEDDASSSFNYTQ